MLLSFLQNIYLARFRSFAYCCCRYVAFLSRSVFCFVSFSVAEIWPSLYHIISPVWVYVCRFTAPYWMSVYPSNHNVFGLFEDCLNGCLYQEFFSASMWTLALFKRTHREKCNNKLIQEWIPPLCTASPAPTIFSRSTWDKTRNFLSREHKYKYTSFAITLWISNVNLRSNLW